MNKIYQKKIYNILKRAIESGYKAGIQTIVQLNKKMQYADAKYSVSYTAADEEAIHNFLLEAFQVAGVGSIELERKLKEAGEKLMRGEIKSKDDFELEVRRLMMNYGVDLADQPPSGWIQTNIDTAITSATNAARWKRLNEKGIGELYPALEYCTQRDIAVREEHAAMDGLIYRRTDPIWDTIYPPNGWNCRCYCKPIGITEAEQYNILESNEKTRKEYMNLVENDFRRNSGKTDSIWDKWLRQKYRDMSEKDVAEIKRSLKNW